MIILSFWAGHFIEIITLFILILIHELGHVTAAWSYGWRVRSMELFPFGGVAKMDEWGTVSAKEEIVVALAGPFQHVFLVIVSLIYLEFGWWSEEWTRYFIQANILLALFNLLPIFPLDGGRILHSILSYFMSYRLCMEVTLYMSLLLSALMVVGGFFVPGRVVFLPFVVIGLFLFLSNWSMLKQKNVQFLRFLLKRHHQGVDPLFPITRIRVREDVPLPQVIGKWYKERYHVVEVLDGKNRPIGFVPEELLLEQYFQTKRSSQHLPLRELIG